ncbi:MAG: endonuclease/exonuclease/phosphatase family protein [Candidatus Pacebacteria bacterium]|nr:endonuclease/exonuclease/phosphatase family protein [Candidatus Paceibacterota bacterium]
MTIYSWNLLFRNRELDRAFEFISRADFDIFCLQEVPEAFLARLQTLPYHLTSGTSLDRVFRSGVVRDYLVILSRYPIERQGAIPFPDNALSFRGRIFNRLMFPFHFSEARNRGGLYADICLPDTQSTVRVFNLHLTRTQPAWRLREFERAMIERPERGPSGRPAIVCGDFNILEKPHITPLNWLFGGTLRDALLYRRERTAIEKRFVEYELVNPLYGGITHPLSQSQLDHILVSHSFFIKKAGVLPDRVGSDHHPIRVEIS